MLRSKLIDLVVAGFLNCTGLEPRQDKIFSITPAGRVLCEACVKALPTLREGLVAGIQDASNDLILVDGILNSGGEDKNPDLRLGLCRDVPRQREGEK